MNNRFLLPLLVVAATFPISLCADTPEPSGHIVFHDPDSLPSVLHVPPGAAIVVDCELGECGDRFTLIDAPPPGTDWHVLKVEQRRRRCLSLPGEGPHIDLLDWKSSYTPWKEMKRAQWNKWQSASFTPTDYAPFPDFTLADVEAQIRLALKDSDEAPTRWIDIAKECLREKETCILECETEIRFLEIRTEGEKLVRSIRVRVPMGC